MKNAFSPSIVRLSKYVSRLLIAWSPAAVFVRVANSHPGNKNLPVIPGAERAVERKRKREHTGAVSRRPPIGTGRNLRSRVPVRRPLHLYLTTAGPNLEDKWDYHRPCVFPGPEGTLEIKRGFVPVVDSLVSFFLDAPFPRRWVVVSVRIFEMTQQGW